MMESHEGLKIQKLGSEELALKIARRAQQCVPAYGRLLEANCIDQISRLDTLPLTDKAGYLGSFPYGDLLADDYDRAFTVFKSSGASGKSFYWPQLKATDGSVVVMLRDYLESVFRIKERRTLAIVGLALGSWIGGEHVSWVLKSLAATSAYPFSVFSPGSVHDEIIAMIKNAESFVDQFLIFLCPSAIQHLHLKAAEQGIELPHSRMRYMVLGEAFPESFRMSLQQASGVSAGEPVMLSMYGSADTGFLGVESPATVALRQALILDPKLAGQFGVCGVVPHFFHFIGSDVYVENIQGELCVTRWQGIPLVRYNLHDAVELLSWKKVVAMISRSDMPLASFSGLGMGLRSLSELPDLIAIYGRSDGCLILCGTNITESMLDQTVRAPCLSKWLTGIYKAEIQYKDNRQFLSFTVEWRQGAPMDAAVIDEVYTLLVQQLGYAQPEFLDDWKNIYHIWDHEIAHRILRITPVCWPEMSNKLEKSIKHRGTKG